MYMQCIQLQIDVKHSVFRYYLRGKAHPPPTIANFTDPSVLEALRQQIKLIKHTVTSSGCTGKPLWLGESGSASGGGVRGLTDSYVAGFM